MNTKLHTNFIKFPNEIIEFLENIWESSLCIYLHGSRVYGCYNEKSDYDFIIVAKENGFEANELSFQDTDVIIYEKNTWDEMAKNNECDFMECIFLPKEFKLKEDYIPEFDISVKKIRSNFSKKASNSFVKCKKKLTVQKDYNPYIAKKSLFHSFRLLQFGTQIIKYGKIIDYSSANALFQMIVNDENCNWEHFKEKWQPLYNKHKSTFREVERNLVFGRKEGGN